MKPVDSIFGYFSGRGRDVRPIELAEGEHELAREVAQLRPGSMNSVSGDLILSTAHLVFRPLELRDARALLTWPLDCGAPGALARVRAGDPTRTVSPPTLVIEAADGRTTEVGILASRFSPSAGRSDRTARDRMVTAVTTRLLLAG